MEPPRADDPDPAERVRRIAQADVRAAARLMRDLDDRVPGSLDILKTLFRERSSSYILGVTGPPGVGKSTLIDRLIGVYRGRGLKIGGILVDPTSPFSGGAILGDRVRMQRHSTDREVFLRSLATRGHLGGLSRSALDILAVMEAMGKDLVLLETVGIGQAEVEVAEVAHTTLVVLAPGLGDGIQAIKAGVLEIADIFVVNKADREGADRTQMDLTALVESDPDSKGWRRPVLTTVAAEGKGLEELEQAIQSHRAYMESSGQIASKRRRRALRELTSALQDVVDTRVIQKLVKSGRLEQVLTNIMDRAADPYTLAEGLLGTAMAETADGRERR